MTISKKIFLSAIFITLSAVSYGQSVDNSGVRQKYMQKEHSLLKKYQLTENERRIVNKSKGRELTFKEKVIYARAMNKHTKHVKKRRKLQKKREKEVSTRKN